MNSKWTVNFHYKHCPYYYCYYYYYVLLLSLPEWQQKYTSLSLSSSERTLTPSSCWSRSSSFSNSLFTCNIRVWKISDYIKLKLKINSATVTYVDNRRLSCLLLSISLMLPSSSITCTTALYCSYQCTLCLRKNVTLFIFVITLSDVVRFC